MGIGVPCVIIMELHSPTNSELTTFRSKKSFPLAESFPGDRLPVE